MSLFKLSNQIFALGLDAKELSVYAYLCSLPSLQNTIDNSATIKVKQATIAQNCGLRAVQTVAAILARLQSKGLVEQLTRSVKADYHKGTYSYAVRKLPVTTEYFFVDRQVLGMMNPRQMAVYLFLCKAYDAARRDSWNSYNDISEQLGMKREAVVQTVAELAAMKLIVRMRRKSRENRRVFVDNHYQIIRYVRGTIHKMCKKIVRLHSQCNRTGVQRTAEHFKLPHYSSTYSEKSQEVKRNLFFGRGSPIFCSHSEYPSNFPSEKEKIKVYRKYTSILQ